MEGRCRDWHWSSSESSSSAESRSRRRVSPVLRVGMAQEGGGGGIGGLAKQGEPGGEQAPRCGGAQRDAVGQIERAAVELQAPGERPGVFRIGRADGKGSPVPVGFGQQSGERFGFVGGLVEDMDLVLIERQRLVLPAVGKGAAPGIEAIRFGFRGENMELHIAGFREGLQACEPPVPRGRGRTTR